VSHQVNPLNPPVESAQFEIRWNRRSYRRNVLFLTVLFLGYVAAAIFASGALQLIGLAGAVVFGLIGICGGLAGELQMRRHPVVATLSDSGITIRQRDPVSWEGIREVRLGTVKPRFLFTVRPFHYIAFLPTRTTDLSRLSPRGRLAIKLYGTNLLLITQNVSPAAEDILDAIDRLADVPVRRFVDD
jgi:hypothetical protein